MFLAALFTIANTWKQAKCPSKDEWIKMYCVYMCVCVFRHYVYRQVSEYNIKETTLIQRTN